MSSSIVCFASAFDPGFLVCALPLSFLLSCSYSVFRLPRRGPGGSLYIRIIVSEFVWHLSLYMLCVRSLCSPGRG